MKTERQTKVFSGLNPDYLGKIQARRSSKELLVYFEFKASA